jgi:uncharacterized membrane-anchored protein
VVRTRSGFRWHRRASWHLRHPRTPGSGTPLGYGVSAVLFALAIAAVAVARLALDLGAVTSFWIAYVLTRPLGASMGDHLSQPTGDGGLGLGTVVTGALFLTVILALVIYLSVTRTDATEPERAAVNTH